MAIELRDTVSLMQAMERITPPASFCLIPFSRLYRRQPLRPRLP